MAVLDRIRDGDSARWNCPRLAVLTGPGGVGKTALAVSWATRNMEHFPDGQLYADLRGFSDDAPMASDVALGRLLRGLGIPPERVPVELAEQTALFRSLTAEQRLLIVVDNVLSAAQFRPLLPTSALSMVIVTSRVRLAALHEEGGVFVEVDPLSHDHSVELLTRSLGPQRVDGQVSELGELASLCGNLPIALRLVSARLVARPRWKVARIVEQLSDERNRLAILSTGADVSLDNVFTLTYRALSEDNARLFRSVSLHPGPEFNAGLSAAAAGMTEHAAAQGLQELMDAHLVDEVDEDRYRCHDLVRLHGRLQLERSAQDLDAIRRRIVEWILHSTTRANMVVIPIRWRVSQVDQQYRGAPTLFDTGAAALAWLDDQLPNILAVLADSVRRGWYELAWQLCEALWELFLHRKHYQHWLASHELGIAAAQRCGNEVAESRLRCQLARAYLDLHRFPEAEQECNRAAELARLAGDRRNESVAVDQLGKAAQGQGNVDRAIVLFQASLLIEQELGIDRGVAQRERRIGEAFLQSGRHEKARAHLEQARKAFAALSDTKDEAKVLVGLARIDAHSGHTDAAKSRLTFALEVLSTSGSATYHADVLVALGEISRDQDDLVAARRYLTSALELCEKAGGPSLERVQALLSSLDPGDLADDA
jgi:tetratricopeptide (TPR) repeat protein